MDEELQDDDLYVSKTRRKQLANSLAQGLGMPRIEI